MPGSGNYFLLMPGCVTQPDSVGAKLATIVPDNAAAGRPTIQALIVLFDAATGAPSALIDGTSVTTIRTAAVSGLATRLLSRTDATSHGVFGTGALAPAHIDAIRAVRPGIERVLIWGRSFDKARELANRESQRTGCQVDAVADPAEAAACDVVSMLTAAKEPVLKGEWLQAGAHLNLVGPHSPTEREADTLAITRSRVYVDMLEGALRESGDLLIPIGEGAFSREGIVGEIGQVVLGQVAGRRSSSEITLYKSLGVVTQDLFAAQAIVERASKLHIGTRIDM
jgi:ornithine cyclodeaminase